MQKISNWFYRVSQGWLALAGLIIFMVFTALVLPGQAAQAETYSGDVGSPDSSFFYTADQVYQFAETYGPQGRRSYIQARWTFDVAWPLVYTLFLATAITWLTKKAGQQNGPLKSINIIPVFAMTLDFLENTATSIVMARYPLKTPVVAHLSGFFTTLKWLLIGGSFLALFVVLVMAVITKVREMRGSSE